MSPVDRGKGGIKRSMVVDALAVSPLGIVIAPANRHDSLLLAATLNTLQRERFARLETELERAG